MDRGYVDYKWLYKVHSCGSYFVTTAKDNMNYRRVKSYPKNSSDGIIYDQLILLNGFYAANDYPVPTSRIKYLYAESGKVFIFISNKFQLLASGIAKLYKHRWMIELFYKWIKQNLKIKSSWGHSENAVKTQIWIEISIYTLVAIAEKRFQSK
jgi:hypothetical protein